MFRGLRQWGVGSWGSLAYQISTFRTGSRRQNASGRVKRNFAFGGPRIKPGRDAARVGKEARDRPRLGRADLVQQDQPDLPTRIRFSQLARAIGARWPEVDGRPQRTHSQRMPQRWAWRAVLCTPDVGIVEISNETTNVSSRLSCCDVRVCRRHQSTTGAGRDR